MIPAIRPTTKIRTVYYLKYRPLLFLLAVFMLALGLRALLRNTSLLLSLTCFFNAGWMFACAQILRIVISPNGIAYHNSGLYKIETTWENVIGIQMVPFSLAGLIQCVVLQESSVTGWTGLAWMIPTSERGRTIPLSNGWANLPELEQSIHYYLAENQSKQKIDA